MQVNWKTNSAQPTLFKRQAEWSGVKVSHLRVLPGEMPEHSLPFYEIIITLAGSLDDIIEGLAVYAAAGVTDLRLMIASRNDDERAATREALAAMLA